MIDPIDIACAELCAGIYDRPGYPDVIWDHVDVGDDDGVYWALKRLPGYDVVVLRGSVTARDWLRDFMAIANPLESSLIGPVHPGFMLGMVHVATEILPLLRQPLVITGHSLGAGRAAVLTALMVAGGVPPPVARVVFGEPKPGFVRLARLIEKVPGRSYRNGDDRHHDLVTDVPFSFPPQQYVHPTPVIEVCERPGNGLFDQLGVFAWHDSMLYLRALRALAAPLGG